MKINLLLLLLLFSAGAQAQLNLDIRNHDITYFKKQEQLLKSNPFSLNTTYVQSADIDQPLAYRRKQQDVPDLLVYYFAYKKDGAIAELQYEWDARNFEKVADSVKKPLSVLKPYVAKYQELLTALTIKYGKAKSTGGINDMSLIETGNFTETDTWDLDAMTIKVTIVLSNRYLKRGIITITPTHRIRLYIKDKT